MISRIHTRPQWDPKARQIHVLQQELVLLFPHVSVPKDSLTNQSMPFISKLMTDVCQLLQVEQTQTSIYHPPDRQACGEVQPNLEGDAASSSEQRWKELGPPPPLHPNSPFHEMPQVSTGFTPFELLFGMWPWGPAWCGPRGMGGTAIPLPRIALITHQYLQEASSSQGVTARQPCPPVQP